MPLTAVQSERGRFRFTRTALAALVLAAVAAAGCGPAHEGPQLADPPEGMGYINSMSSARKPLPGRATTRQLGYIRHGDAGDMVVITEYPGPTTEDEVERARDGYEKRYTSTEYGPLRSLKVDGRRAWGWLETQRLRGEVAAVQLTAVVPYDDVTYSIELSLHPPHLMSEEAMRAIVESFFVN